MKISSIRIVTLSFILCFVCFVSRAQNMMTFQQNILTRAIGQINREEFQRIGIYKVKGNSFVLSGKNVSDVYTTGGDGMNQTLMFDAHTQNVSILQENKTDIATLTLDELDSFIVKVDNDGRFYRPAIFINASKIEAGKKIYMERLEQGPRYALYKSYKAEMRKATQDLAQTNIMEFEIVSEYFYLPFGANEFVKIKSNLSSLKKQFVLETEAVKILSSSNKENFQDNLTVFFQTLNSKK